MTRSTRSFYILIFQFLHLPLWPFSFFSRAFFFKLPLSFVHCVTIARALIIINRWRRRCHLQLDRGAFLFESTVCFGSFHLHPTLHRLSLFIPSSSFCLVLLCGTLTIKLQDNFNSFINYNHSSIQSRSLSIRFRLIDAYVYTFFVSFCLVYVFIVGA